MSITLCTDLSSQTSLVSVSLVSAGEGRGMKGGDTVVVTSSTIERQGQVYLITELRSVVGLLPPYRRHVYTLYVSSLPNFPSPEIIERVLPSVWTKTITTRDPVFQRVKCMARWGWLLKEPKMG